VAGTTGFHLDQNFICFGMRAFHFLDRERHFEIVQDSGFHLPLALQEREGRLVQEPITA
jgi:hypothetical protein